MQVKSVYDVQQLLKLYGIIIYMHDRTDTLELMSSEIRELYQAGLIEETQYIHATMILKQALNDKGRHNNEI